MIQIALKDCIPDCKILMASSSSLKSIIPRISHVFPVFCRITSNCSESGKQDLSSASYRSMKQYPDIVLYKLLH